MDCLDWELLASFSYCGFLLIINSFKKQLLSIYYIPGTNLGDTTTNREKDGKMVLFCLSIS